MNELLAESDLITLHCPYTPGEQHIYLIMSPVVYRTIETRHLLSDAQFASMKKGVYIVNTSRGAGNVFQSSFGVPIMKSQVFSDRRGGTRTCYEERTGQQSGARCI